MIEDRRQKSPENPDSVTIEGHYETVYHIGIALFGFGGYYKVVGYNRDGSFAIEGEDPALKGVCTMFPWVESGGKESVVITTPLPRPAMTPQLLEDLQISPFTRAKPKEIAARIFKGEGGKYSVRLYRYMPNGRTLEEFARELPPPLSEAELRRRENS